jgi:2-polyprenyl-3-methyl-5-hydroxy-6-metoxy-1,4-benzoquinol methylase
MNKAHFLELHKMAIPEGYLPDPYRHLNNARDKVHFDWALKNLTGCSTVLDVGCFDGWLDFLLMDQGFKFEGVELVPELARAANNYAKSKALEYQCYEGLLTELDLRKKYDCCLCFEVLEHLPLVEVQEYLSIMENLTNKLILISLPDQKIEDNIQHQWTPSLKQVIDLFGEKKDFEFAYVRNDRTVPNFFISYKIQEE